MSLGIVTATADGVEEEKNIIERSAQGETSGIDFGTISLEDVDKAKILIEALDAEYTKTKFSAYISAISAVGSIARDMPYAIAGRKYVRGTSFNNRMGSAYARAVMLGWVEEVLKQ